MFFLLLYCNFTGNESDWFNVMDKQCYKSAVRKEPVAAITVDRKFSK